MDKTQNTADENVITLTPQDMVGAPEGIAIGRTYPVGGFFWIRDEDLIGFDFDAQHCHGKNAGSVEFGCTVTVRGFKDGRAIVRLDRPSMPAGAEAAIGTVFKISLAKMEAWPEAIAKRELRMAKREELASEYLK